MYSNQSVRVYVISINLIRCWTLIDSIYTC